MKKIVPDPPYPIPYITIINDLTAPQAMAHAATLMDTLGSTVQAYVECPPEHRKEILLDNAGILSQLVAALIKHSKCQEAAQ